MMMMKQADRFAFAGLLVLTFVAVARPAVAQEESVDPGRNAEVAGTELGERQTREESAASVEPMQRISNRVENRIQNRIRNRIDRDYDPKGNATSSFDRASKRADAMFSRPQRR